MIKNIKKGFKAAGFIDEVLVFGHQNPQIVDHRILPFCHKKVCNL